MTEHKLDKAAVVALLNEILETELAGVVRYTHYALMVFGYSRIPIVSWLRAEATTSLMHANEAGELVTHFGEHPSLKIGALLETHKHGINDILLEALEAETRGRGARKIVLNARDNAAEFYRKRGYAIIGDAETLFGVIRHVRMTKSLQ